MAESARADTTRVAAMTEDELLARLEAMVPRLLGRAQETERLRQLPDETVAEAIASGFIGAFRPREYGGSGLGLSALANGTRILAHGCASSAWTLVFLSQHIWMIGKMPEAMQVRFLSNGELPLIASALAAVGTATRVEGGYLLTGTSEWNSAIGHAQWTSIKATIDGEVHSFYMPVSEVQRDDNWHTSGMRGTSSDSFSAKDVFVPDDLVMPLRALAVSVVSHPDEPFIDYPYIASVAITCSAVVIGAAEAAVDHFEQKMRSRVLAFSANQGQADQPFGQMRLGEADLRMRMARELWDSCIRDMDTWCGAGGTMTPVQRVGVRARCALAVRECRALISEIMSAAGGSSYFLTAQLQRIQRDVEVLKSHAIFDWDRAAQLQGRLRLGLDPAPTDLV